MKTRKSFWFKSITVFVGLNLLAQIFYPTVAFALTGGPSQPEMQSFEPIENTQMVDLSTGSFTYNIPLMDVEGYPINLSYHSGVTMDEDASWVGLGWNINPGEISRQLRGIPDEFNGDEVTEQYNLKDNTTVGFDAGVGLKLFGIPAIGLNLDVGVFTNNYKGPGIEFGITPTISCGIPIAGGLTGDLGINFNSQSGIDVTPKVGFAPEALQALAPLVDASLSISSTYNSRTGIKGLEMQKDIGFLGGGYSRTYESTVSFSNPTYFPTMTFPLLNNAITADVTAGLAAFGIHANGTITGYWTQQTLATHAQSLPAYGYMYADKAKDNPMALHDFNRDEDYPFRKNIQNLPITNFTYDIFNVRGQGIGGQFRPFRGDVGVLYDHLCTDQTTSAELGLELGFTWVSHVGVNVSVTNASTYTDKWTADNTFATTVDFQSLQPDNLDYEPFYFKEAGQRTVNDVNYYGAIGDVNPMYVRLNQFGSDVVAADLFDIIHGPLGVSGNLVKTQRERREQCFSLLTASEATYFGLEKDILSYPLNTNVYKGNCDSATNITHIPRMTYPGHHTSEISVVNPDGKRYVYGIPAYNLTQVEATFSASGTVPDYIHDSIPLVGYTHNVDNSVNNLLGRENYFNREVIPQYAHSYLLSGVLSPDYVDLTGDGITDDDLGEAVKFNYTKLYGSGNSFNWRMPVEHDQAKYQMGLLTDNMDDKGNYIYGQKEVWYVHSIESKTMVAQFILEDRLDALGVMDENGGVDPSKHLKRLKEIDLYSKADLIKNGSNAVPIKTVHFVYDDNYQLCPGTPNSVAPGYGKLTLKAVYFTYGNNQEGSLNSYQFNYSGFNPSYNHDRYDRWGYYKCTPAGMPSPEDFPYTLQDSIRTNEYATAWNLTDIDLPSGGHIKVNYESNDYAYVQNQRANQMFFVTGASDNPAYPGDPSLYNSSTSYKNWLDITIPVPENNPASFYNDYLSGVDSAAIGSKLYFRFLMDVDGQGHYEYVPGYADIGTYQMVGGNPYHWAIQISQVSTGDNSVTSANPIALSSWQFVRLNLPQYAYPGSQTNGGVLGIIEGLCGIMSSVIQVFEGFDGYCASNNFGNNFIPDHSFIRLDNPNYKKYGGGSRVREIDISDNWSKMVYTQQSSFTYGQTFNYTTTLNGSNRIISSGVATYEPLVGGDENPCRQPLPYSEKEICAPNGHFYTEKPLGESMYPSPGIIYSKVTVTNLQYPGVNRTATGYTVNQFYTAKDFPVWNNFTGMDVVPITPSILSSIFSFSSQDFMNASQGFSIEVNDMAGKEKSQEIYDANSSLISSINYYYHVDNPSAPSLHLNNNVQVVNPDGSISTASVGKDIDTWEDMREQDTQTEGLTMSLNNESFIIPLIFVPLYIDIPVAFSIPTTQHIRFRSGTNTKYVHRTGLLDSVVKTLNGSTISSINQLYDAETGDVVLTQTNNEFDAPVYDFTYPAHWAYDGMGGAYQNIGGTTSGINITSGAIPSSYLSFFAPGDEVECTKGGVLQPTKYWVTEANAGQLILMDGTGALANLTGVSLKVIRSGRRNMASSPIQAIASLDCPVNSTNVLKPTYKMQILQAGATLYSDAWQIPINNIMTLNCEKTESPSMYCVAQFFDSLVTYHELFAKPGDSITFGDYVDCAYDTMQYYALTDSAGYDYMTGFSAILGGCTMTISSLSGYPIYLDSLSPYQNPSAPSLSYNDETGCINLFYDRSSEDVDLNIMVAQLCMDCESCQKVCQNLALNQPFNPYAVGMLGDWRPQRDYAYYNYRSPSRSANTSDIWNTGTFGKFSSIWDLPPPKAVWPIDTVDKNWTWTNQITMYDQKGNELEKQDALGRYSGSLFGYLLSLQVASAINARYQDIGFDGFEDYGFTTYCSNTCVNDHWSFNNSTNSTLGIDSTSLLAHTGKYSLKVPAGLSAWAGRSINYYSPSLYNTTLAGQFLLLPGGNIPLFSPDSGKYMVSAWVNENNNCPTGYSDIVQVTIHTSLGTLNYSFNTSGAVIDGWQRIMGVFPVPGNATEIDVYLKAAGNTAYFDDARIQPFPAEMQTFVFDPFSLRPMATLDESNYATFYEYNDEGILMRVKKETEKGIKTIKESRSSYPRK